MKCPASICPLMAKDGSPWSGEKDADCPGFGGIDNGGCPWWDMACGENGCMDVVIEVEKFGGKSVVLGPNKPKKDNIGVSKSYNCDKESFCRWQEQSPTGLCAPREALKRGLDPRVCLF